MATASWLLDCFRNMIELCLTHGINLVKSPALLLASDATTIHRIPKSIKTVYRWLGLEPSLIEMNCCQSCFALYPLQRTPTTCTHLVSRIPGGPPDSADPDIEISTSIPEYTPDDSEFAEKTCGQPLLKISRGQKVPVRKFAFQSLAEWIARLLSRPDVELWLDESLEESCKAYNPQDKISDIHQSRVWKKFCGPDGKQFTATSGHLIFGLFIDAINPYGNKTSGKHASITFIVMVCLTLPVRIRNRPENVFIVGIAPGPREPSLEQTNWILRPIVTELQILWNPGLLLSQTHLYKEGRLVKVALLPVIADIPALRRSLGFPSATATNFCSICHLTKPNINIVDPNEWEPRTCAQHKSWALQARDSKTVKERKLIFQTHGVRYSVLIELEYWNIIDYHVIDAMHNLLLGLLSWHVRRLWAMKDVKNEEDELPPISKVELLDLYLERSQPTPKKQHETTPEEDDDEGVESVQGIAFGEYSSSNDEDYDPLGDVGWNGPWNAPPLDEIIFDEKMLRRINALLPRIHIPTWIKRAIRVLGKASFGKLKADEWRNLFALQLPLILIPMWFGQDNVKSSLLKNFIHLGSLVNLALKREINSDQIDRYKHHIQKYLEGSLQLFQHCKLAPNHHIAIHLAGRLEEFGPVRAEWSFPFERLMGSILKGSHNNHIGKLSLWKFCQHINGLICLYTPVILTLRCS